MNKRLFTLVVIPFLVFMITSCNNKNMIAFFPASNNSQFLVSELHVLTDDESSNAVILEPGEGINLLDGWSGSEKALVMLRFKMNGQEYGVGGEEEVLSDPLRFKPAKQVRDGDKVIVNIYDDHWEW